MQGPGLLEPICVGLSLLVPLELFSPGLVCSRRLEPSTFPGDAEASPGAIGSGTAVPGLAAAFKAN